MSLRRIASLSLAILLCAPLPAASLGGSKKENEQAGANLFRDKGCAYCHGATAAGTPKAPTLDKARKTWKPDRIASQIKDGGQKMPAFGDSLTDAEVSQLIAWIRARHRPLPAPVATPVAKQDASSEGQKPPVSNLEQ